jgi:penicillin-insensitive murein endopeptidase
VRTGVVETAVPTAPVLALLLVARLAGAAHAGAPDAGAPDAAGTAPPPPADTRTTAQIAALWNRQHTPAPGPARAIGATAAGCLQGAEALSLRGPGYVLIRPSRRRGFGHPAMLAFLRRLAAATKQKRLPPLLIGDVSQARGGPTPSGHRSHQSGLDVDLFYALPHGVNATQLLAPLTETIVLPPVVDLHTHKMTRYWTEAVRTLIEQAARDSAVDRIFVNPAIKRQLCHELPRDTAWLGRLRPWWAHHDHFHVRLACPADSPACVPQDPLPPGDGCTAMDWWFTPDSQSTQTKKQKAEAATPIQLPPACAAVLDAPSR